MTMALESEHGNTKRWHWIFKEEADIDKKKKFKSFAVIG